MDFIRPLLCSWSSPLLRGEAERTYLISWRMQRFVILTGGCRWTPLYRMTSATLLHSQVIALQFSMAVCNSCNLAKSTMVAGVHAPRMHWSIDQSLRLLRSLTTGLANGTRAWIRPTRDAEELHPSFTELETPSSFIFVRKLFVLNRYASKWTSTAVP